MEKEPRVITEVRQLVNSLPEDFCADEPNLVNLPEFCSDGDLEQKISMAKYGYGVLAYMLNQQQSEAWSVAKICEESVEIGLWDGNNEINFKSAILLLVVNLEKKELVDFAKEDQRIITGLTKFYFRQDYRSRACAYDFCADLALDSGLSDIEVNSFRGEADFYRKKAEFLGE